MKTPLLTPDGKPLFATDSARGSGRVAATPDQRDAAAPSFAAALAQAERHPRHLPVGGNVHGGENFQHTAMNLRARRQQLIASNIANADTPGYKAVDIDLQEALRTAAANASPLSLLTTWATHLRAESIPTLPPIPLKYVVPSQPGVDGNTVDMDLERGKFAENALMYEFSMDRVSGHYKHMMEMLKELK